MFRSNTVFIVGAGASSEAGLPTGAKLATNIARKLDFNDEMGGLSGGDPAVANVLERYNDPATGRPCIRAGYLEACRFICESMGIAPSIDTFIDTHADNPAVSFCGKLGIVASILEAERKSAELYVDTNNIYNRLDLKKLEGTWYRAFMTMLLDGIHARDPASAFANVSCITFNYDRCIEHVLVDAMDQYFTRDRASAVELVQQIPILHPYGTVGALHGLGNGPDVQFGGDYRKYVKLLEVVPSIRTFTEEMEDQTLRNQVRELVTNAETVVFLGFGFNDRNLELIRPAHDHRIKRIFGTAYGESDSNSEVIRDAMFKWTGRKRNKPLDVNLGNWSCAELFDQFSRSLPA